jgi:tripartite-type tricarboxylate transporter receptor subunit TctC
MRRRILHATLAALAAMMCAAAPDAAQAQTYPAGPIRVIVGFGPGSTADTLARLTGKHLEGALGQPVVVENRPGNSSMTAAEAVARAPKDGHTLFMGTIAQTLVPIRTRSKFDLRKTWRRSR